MLKHTLTVALLLGLLLPALASSVEDITRIEPTEEQIEAFVDKAGEFGNGFRLDVTGDNLEEIFLGFTCGNAGCDYWCFKNNGNGTYKYVGRLFLRKGYFEVLDSTHNGFNDLLVFWHRNAGSAFRIRYEMSDKGYVAADKVEVKTEDMPKINAPSVTIW